MLLHKKLLTEEAARIGPDGKMKLQTVNFLIHQNVPTIAAVGLKYFQYQRVELNLLTEDKKNTPDKVATLEKRLTSS